MRHRTLLLLTLAAATVAGCKSGPAKVCAKIDALANQASQTGDEGAKEMAAKMKAESSTCVSRMQKMEASDPETFAKASTCIDEATELKGVVACFFQAALGDQAKKGDGAAKAGAGEKAAEGEG